MSMNEFRNSFAENVFRFKYAQGPGDTWAKLSERLVEDVCGSREGTTSTLMSETDRKHERSGATLHGEQ